VGHQRQQQRENEKQTKTTIKFKHGFLPRTNAPDGNS
jgi:hypothetical protein